MQSTMQDVPLTLGFLLRHGLANFGKSKVVTCTGEATRETTFREVGEQAAQLANALVELGIGDGDRVATFQWNNAEHVASYLAIPGMGAVLHTLNVRLFPEQVTYVANHAEDRVIIVDASIAPLLAKALPEMKTVEHVLVLGGDGESLPGWDRPISRYEDVVGEPSRRRSTGATISTSVRPRPCATRAARPAIPRASSTRTARSICTRWRPAWAARSVWASRPGAAGRADVPRERLGLAVRGLDGRRRHDHAGPFPAGRVPLPADDRASGRPSWPACRPSGRRCCAAVENKLDLSFVAHGDLRRFGRSLSLMKGFQEQLGVRVVQAWGMTETSPLGARSRTRRRASATTRSGRTAAAPAGCSPASSAASSTTPGDELPADGDAVGEFEVRGPWVTGAYYQGDDPEQFRRTAGCAPAMSARSTAWASCRSPTAPRTSSSPAASGSAASIWRTR